MIHVIVDKEIHDIYVSTCCHICDIWWNIQSGAIDRGLNWMVCFGLSINLMKAPFFCHGGLWQQRNEWQVLRVYSAGPIP